MNTDKINIPVDLINEKDIQAVIKQIRDRLQAGLKDLILNVKTGDVPAVGKPAVSAQEVIEIGGKKFRVGASLRSKQQAAQIAAETGDDALFAMHTEFNATVKEIKDKAASALTADAKKLRDFKNRIKFQPLEVKKQQISEFIKEHGDINNELQFRLERVNQLLSKKEFSKFKKSIDKLSPEEGIRAYTEYMKQDDALVDLAAAERKKLIEIFKRNTIQSQRLRHRDLKTNIADLKLDDQIKALENALQGAGGEFARLIKRDLMRLRDKAKNLRFRDVKADALSKPLGDREKLFQDYINSGGEFVKEAQRQIDRIRLQLSKTSKGNPFADAKKFIITQPLEDMETLWQNFLADNPKFGNEVINEINKVKQKISRRTLRQHKVDISTKPIEEQIRAWQDFIQQHEEFTDLGNQQIKKLSKRWVDATRSMNRSKFIQWTKQIQTMDPVDAIKELDKYISAPFSKFVEDAKLLRIRMRKSAATISAQMQRERQRQFANTILTGAGAGLGLLGAAGFPLLNVGFAAMSGGAPAAALVGFTTALGEGSRAMDNFVTRMTDAAKEVGLVPKAFKEAEARSKGFDAILGLGALTSQRVAMEERLKMWRENGAEWFDTSRWWRDLTSSFGTYRDQFVNNFTLSNFLKPGGLFSGTDFYGIYATQRERSGKAVPEDLESAYRSMLMNMSRPTVGIETDPYQTYLRMQQAALDPNKQEELRIAQEQLKVITEIRDEILERAKEREPEPSPILSNIPLTS